MNIEINEEHLFLKMKNKEGEEIECCDNEMVLAMLLLQKVCFLSYRPYSLEPNKKMGDKIHVDGKTMVVHVDCDDLFEWGCTDVEDLPREEIGNLYKMWKSNGRNGVNKWCCLRRKLRPQVPIVEQMKKDGFWDAELETLPAPEPS